VRKEEKFQRGIMVIGAVGDGFKSEMGLGWARDDAAEYHALAPNASIGEGRGRIRATDSASGAGCRMARRTQDGAPSHTAQSDG
jgi:hypothetical protein